VDLNADLGELPGPAGEAVDRALLATVTSANVACGGHAGDEASMRRVCAVAVLHGVAVGAQVSYVDRAGFGRRRLDVHPRTLARQLGEQIGALDDAARGAGTTVSYVKPHGALYHAAGRDPEVAGAVLDAMHATIGPLPVLTLHGSALARSAAAQGIPVIAEAYADRGYSADGSLVPRDHPDAVLHDHDDVVARVVRLAATGTVVAVDGTHVRVRAESICVHGDTPGAVSLAAAVRRALVSHGIPVEAFVRAVSGGV
jgi:UPF0271 protein